MDRLATTQEFIIFAPVGHLNYSLNLFFMEKTPFYRTKAFWTLIASIVAALAAYFTVSCSYSQKLFRHGIHHDTVRIESIIKSRQLSCLTTNPGTPSPNLLSSNLELISWKHSLLYVPTIPSTVATSPFGSPSRIAFGSKPRLIPLSKPACHSIFPSNKNCSIPGVTVLSMSSRSWISSFSFTLASLVPTVPLGRSRRGGRRKGKPRPKVKNIIIGGRHL